MQMTNFMCETPAMESKNLHGFPGAKKKTKRKINVENVQRWI